MRTVVEMRDGTRGNKLIRASVSRKGNVDVTKRYMLESFLRPYVRREAKAGEAFEDALSSTRRGIVWKVVAEDELGQEMRSGGAYDVSSLVSYLGDLPRHRACNELAEEVIEAAIADIPTLGSEMERWMVEELMMRQLGSSARANGDPGPAVMEARHQILAILDEIDGYIRR